MKTLTKAQFDNITKDSKIKITSNKSAYKKDDNGQKYHQTVIKYIDAKGEKRTAVREVDMNGTEYYEI